MNQRYNDLMYYASPFERWIDGLSHAKNNQLGDICSQKLLSAIDHFKHNIRHNDEQTIEIAVYCLCAFIHEALRVIKSQRKTNWENINLMKKSDQALLAGERFFEYLNQVIEKKPSALKLIQFFYFLLSIGYKGKYFDDHKKLDQIKNQLLNLTRDMPLVNATSPVIRKDKKSLPIIKILCPLIVLMMTNLIMNIYSFKVAKPVFDQLHGLELKIIHQHKKTIYSHSN
jgi:type IV/VI secretion system ImpK/VasF family protein